ncbi:MAG: carboxylating nicotinate-nucleotide diphosphorylase [Endomicrobium sp.]|jgi:nicotinate-nucleotide pyrophosphorylase (carboxylating)|uniref:carboxylating nicotinate-nucleotide diphosphorylase n=1 Tax=Candidatus Endomicrobiellum cubanum TaxID=3242325 RepID=UPI00282963CE|nr:carboxylating nicotinate-nucleotide diphosphorylase [Endomicrobium sp.]
MKNIDTLIKLALKEDGVFNDITTKEFVANDKKASAVLVAKKPGILCGVNVFVKIFKTIDKDCKVTLKLKDGTKIKPGDKILEIYGLAKTILAAERIALNFLQYLSGIATLTNLFVKTIKDSKPKIYDTRKTLPGYRELAKYAVKCGGGHNHRMGLYDMVLIKDNHLKLTKDLTTRIANFRKTYKKIPVEIECETIQEVKQAIDAKADIIMLDNTSINNTKKMIKLIRDTSNAKYKPEIEISGGVNLKTAKNFSKLDIDRISVGMLTHSVSALDLSLEVIIK